MQGQLLERSAVLSRYSIRVVEDLREWLCKKRYSQFLELDAMLATLPIQRLPLPPKGTVGLRKMLNLGNFNQERLQGLARYLSHLASQIQSLSQVPALGQFLSPAPLGQPLAVPTQGVAVASPIQPVAVAQPMAGTVAVAQPMPGTAAVTVSANPAPTLQAQQALQQSHPVAAPVAVPVAGTPVVGVAVASPYPATPYAATAAPVPAQPYPQQGYPVQASPAPTSGGGGGFGMLGAGAAGAMAGVLAGVAGAAMMHGSSHSSHQDFCCKCEGRGFRHNSTMNHDERPDKRCFFCEDCDACRGRGSMRYDSPPHHHHGHHHHHHHRRFAAKLKKQFSQWRIAC